MDPPSTRVARFSDDTDVGVAPRRPLPRTGSFEDKIDIGHPQRRVKNTFDVTPMLRDPLGAATRTAAAGSAAGAGASGAAASGGAGTGGGAAAAAAAGGASASTTTTTTTAGSAVAAAAASAAPAKLVKRKTYAGLSNQGATCYMNSLLQTLFMTPEFRRLLYMYRYNEKTDGPEVDCIPLQLQLLFARLQLTEQRAITTTALTKSFGWDNRNSFEQQDVQELARVLFNALEEELKGTPHSSLVPSLFKGATESYVQCCECGNRRGRREMFLDLPLVIKPFGATKAFASVEEALAGFVEAEVMDGGNKVDCETCGTKTRSSKGTAIAEAPYLLQISLMRFVFNPFTMDRDKVNDKVTFPLVLDLAPYMAKAEPAAAAAAATAAEATTGDAAAKANEAVADGDGDGAAAAAAAEAAAIAAKKAAAAGGDADHQKQQQEGGKEGAADTGRNSPGASATPTTSATDGSNGEAPAATTATTSDAATPAAADGAASGDAPTPPATAATAAGATDALAATPATPVASPYTYDLYAVLVHSGSARSGHYYAYIRDVDSGAWHNFNDSSVGPITEKEVLDASGGGSTGYYGGSANAYLLMYRKRLPAGVTTVSIESEIPADMPVDLPVEGEAGKPTPAGDATAAPADAAANGGDTGKDAAAAGGDAAAAAASGDAPTTGAAATASPVGAPAAVPAAADAPAAAAAADDSSSSSSAPADAKAEPDDDSTGKDTGKPVAMKKHTTVMRRSFPGDDDVPSYLVPMIQASESAAAAAGPDYSSVYSSHRGYSGYGSGAGGDGGDKNSVSVKVTYIPTGDVKTVTFSKQDSVATVTKQVWEAFGLSKPLAATGGDDAAGKPSAAAAAPAAATGDGDAAAAPAADAAAAAAAAATAEPAAAVIAPPRVPLECVRLRLYSSYTLVPKKPLTYNPVPVPPGTTPVAAAAGAGGVVKDSEEGEAPTPTGETTTATADPAVEAAPAAADGAAADAAAPASAASSSSSSSSAPLVDDGSTRTMEAAGIVSSYSDLCLDTRPTPGTPWPEYDPEAIVLVVNRYDTDADAIVTTTPLRLFINKHATMAHVGERLEEATGIPRHRQRLLKLNTYSSGPECREYLTNAALGLPPLMPVPAESVGLPATAQYDVPVNMGNRKETTVIVAEKRAVVVTPVMKQPRLLPVDTPLEAFMDLGGKTGGDGAAAAASAGSSKDASTTIAPLVTDIAALPSCLSYYGGVPYDVSKRFIGDGQRLLQDYLFYLDSYTVTLEDMGEAAAVKLRCAALHTAQTAMTKAIARAIEHQLEEAEEAAKGKGAGSTGTGGGAGGSGAAGGLSASTGGGGGGDDDTTVTMTMDPAFADAFDPFGFDTDAPAASGEEGKDKTTTADAAAGGAASGSAWSSDGFDTDPFAAASKSGDAFDAVDVIARVDAAAAGGGSGTAAAGRGADGDDGDDGDVFGAGGADAEAARAQADMETQWKRHAAAYDADEMMAAVVAGTAGGAVGAALAAVQYGAVGGDGDAPSSVVVPGKAHAGAGEAYRQQTAAAYSRLATGSAAGGGDDEGYAGSNAATVADGFPSASGGAAVSFPREFSQSLLDRTGGGGTGGVVHNDDGTMTGGPATALTGVGAGLYANREEAELAAALAASMVDQVIASASGDRPGRVTGIGEGYGSDDDDDAAARRRSRLQEEEEERRAVAALPATTAGVFGTTTSTTTAAASAAAPSTTTGDDDGMTDADRAAIAALMAADAEEDRRSGWGSGSSLLSSAKPTRPVVTDGDDDAAAPLLGSMGGADSARDHDDDDLFKPRMRSYGTAPGPMAYPLASSLAGAGASVPPTVEQPAGFGAKPTQPAAPTAAAPTPAAAPAASSTAAAAAAPTATASSAASASALPVDPTSVLFHMSLPAHSTFTERGIRPPAPLTSAAAMCYDRASHLVTWKLCVRLDDRDIDVLVAHKATAAPAAGSDAAPAATKSTINRDMEFTFDSRASTFQLYGKVAAAVGVPVPATSVPASSTTMPTFSPLVAFSLRRLTTEGRVVKVNPEPDSMREGKYTAVPKTGTLYVVSGAPPYEGQFTGKVHLRVPDSDIIVGTAWMPDAPPPPPPPPAGGAAPAAASSAVPAYVPADPTYAGWMPAPVTSDEMNAWRAALQVDAVAVASHAEASAAAKKKDEDEAAAAAAKKKADEDAAAAAAKAADSDAPAATDAPAGDAAAVAPADAAAAGSTGDDASATAATPAPAAPSGSDAAGACAPPTTAAAASTPSLPDPADSSAVFVQAPSVPVPSMFNQLTTVPFMLTTSTEDIKRHAFPALAALGLLPQDAVISGPGARIRLRTKVGIRANGVQADGQHVRDHFSYGYDGMEWCIEVVSPEEALPVPMVPNPAACAAAGDDDAGTTASAESGDAAFATSAAAPVKHLGPRATIKPPLTSLPIGGASALASGGSSRKLLYLCWWDRARWTITKRREILIQNTETVTALAQRVARLAGVAEAAHATYMATRDGYGVSDAGIKPKATAAASSAFANPWAIAKEYHARATGQATTAAAAPSTSDDDDDDDVKSKAAKAAPTMAPLDRLLRSLHFMRADPYVDFTVDAVKLHYDRHREFKPMLDDRRPLSAMGIGLDDGMTFILADMDVPVRPLTSGEKRVLNIGPNGPIKKEASASTASSGIGYGGSYGAGAASSSWSYTPAPRAVEKGITIMTKEQRRAKEAKEKEERDKALAATTAALAASATATAGATAAAPAAATGAAPASPAAAASPVASSAAAGACEPASVAGATARASDGGLGAFARSNPLTMNSVAALDAAVSSMVPSASSSLARRSPAAALGGGSGLGGAHLPGGGAGRAAASVFGMNPMHKGSTSPAALAAAAAGGSSRTSIAGGKRPFAAVSESDAASDDDSKAASASASDAEPSDAEIAAAAAAGGIDVETARMLALAGVPLAEIRRSNGGGGGSGSGGGKPTDDADGGGGGGMSVFDGIV